MSATGIGASVRRKEDHRFVTGKGRYVDDINRPGQAHAFFLRSPHAHANIRKIDASAALASPGVIAVLTGEDIAAACAYLASPDASYITGQTISFNGGRYMGSA